jgi:hypothetical protein
MRTMHRAMAERMMAVQRHTGPARNLLPRRRGAITMLPVIYTTYGVAMGHRPEVLSASGGLRPAGAERRRERSAWVGLTRAWTWLGTVAARVHVRLRHTNSRLAADEMGVAARSSNH